MKEVEGYRNYMLAGHTYNSPTSLNNVVGTINQFLSILGVNSIEQIKKLDRSDIDTYLLKLIDLGLKENSRKTKMANVRMFFNYLVEYSLIDKNVTFKKCVKCDSPQKYHYSYDDALRVLNEIHGERNRVIVNTLLGTGIRISELLTLKCEDVLDEEIQVLGKGNKYRWVVSKQEITKNLLEYIEKTKEERKNSPYVFFSHKNKDGYLEESTINYHIKRYAEMANIKRWKGFSAHKFRHIYAEYRLNDLCVPIDVISENLGHADVAITSRTYAKSNKNKMKQYLTK